MARNNFENLKIYQLNFVLRKRIKKSVGVPETTDD